MESDIVARLRAWIPCYRADTDVAVDIANAADEIERLRKERDEARREVCYLTAELDMINHTSVTAESIALEYEWDCFKEEADHNNNYFKTHHR